MLTEISEQIYQIRLNYFPAFLEKCHCKSVGPGGLSAAREKLASLMFSSSTALSNHAVCSGDICLTTKVENQAAVRAFLE